MADNNGRNWWIRWLVGSLYALIILAITTIATNVIANDRQSRDRDDDIKTMVYEQERRNAERFEAILCQLTEIKTQVTERNRIR